LGEREEADGDGVGYIQILGVPVAPEVQSIRRLAVAKIYELQGFLLLESGPVIQPVKILAD
jgi:hypothetical protein